MDFISPPRTSAEKQINQGRGSLIEVPAQKVTEKELWFCEVDEAIHYHCFFPGSLMLSSAIMKTCDTDLQENVYAHTNQMVRLHSLDKCNNDNNVIRTVNI